MVKPLKLSDLKNCNGGLTVILTTGINSPNGTHDVVAPEAANKGALNAFSHVLANVGDIANIDVAVVP